VVPQPSTFLDMQNHQFQKRLILMVNYIEQILKHTFSQKRSKKLLKNHIAFHKNHQHTRITCPKCQADRVCRNGRSKSFSSTASLTKHILAKHLNDKIYHLHILRFFLVLEQIAITLENNISISTISKVREWKIEVK